ncbi:DUF2793 domain-containing protein [Sphingobium sp. H39-3-25]|uniref:DUF2793 domain-containing protein n=1 Tax=Sphingobium arseniciresistens TaxID=3030834 RepID=UPI0023B9B7BB|nr:DUF2793 domain-containing protein [Sphingobium arseniciresistens]
MADENSPRLALPLLHAGPAQKELFHNEALMRIDMLVHATVESADLAAPPPVPEAGQCWIVAPDATGAWAGHAGAIAMWTAGGWRFVAARTGSAVWASDRAHALRHDGAGWQGEPMRADGYYVAGQRVVGARATAIADPGTEGAVVDVQARARIAAILAMLRDHGLIAE